MNKKLKDRYARFAKKWLCGFLGWHKQPHEVEIKGILMIGICPRCGERVMLDSQGNWF